jgi:hypothetical protein
MDLMDRGMDWVADHLPWVMGALTVVCLNLLFAWWQQHAQEAAHMTALGYHQVCVDTGGRTYQTVCSGGQFSVCTTTAIPILRCTWER